MDSNLTSSRDALTATWIELAVRLGILALFLYWSFLLLRPFISTLIWGVVLVVALYPIYGWLESSLGGRRRLAAFLVTIISLLIVVGPVTWVALNLIDGLRTIPDRFDVSNMRLPPAPLTLKNWPLIGDPLYQFWNLASTNSRAALAKIAPQLKPVGGTMVRIAAGVGIGAIKFLIAVVVAGFLFAPAPWFVAKLKILSHRLAGARGEEFIYLAADTIRAVSRGIIGISVLQSILAGLGFFAVGIPGAGLLATGVLVLGIIQIGAAIILIPLIIWVWATADSTTALLFTAYMIPVGLLDNVLKPLMLGRGLDIPMLVILIGVVGGTLSYGFSGLFLGPIVLAVIWRLLIAWISEAESTAGSVNAVNRADQQQPPE